MDNPKKEFSKVYDEHINKIYRFVYLKVNSQPIAEDLTSEAFLKTWEVFKKDVEKIDNIRAFLYKTANNLVIDHYRQKGRINIVPTSEVRLMDTGEDLHEQAAVSSDIEFLKKHLSDLKDDYQNVIIMHYLDDLPIQEIAVTLDKSEGATRTLLHRALKALKEKTEQV